MSELSLVAMAEKLLAADLLIHHNAHAALERVATKVERTAKAEFGEYQPAVGPFPAWAELAESTKEDRERKGFPADEPLLRTGEVRDSIGHEVADLDAVIGSDSDILVYHEFGTAKMSPRPVLGPALQMNEAAIVRELGGAVVAGLIGEDVVHGSLGYDRVVER
jgi:phage gpG-like protein